MERLVCVPIILVGFITIAVLRFSFCHAKSNVVCHEREKTALLRFKQGLRDPSNRLSSWSIEEDCCKWTAVGCDNVTGHVIKLDLRNPNIYNKTQDGHEFIELAGEISSSLLELKRLVFLDLSYNNFTNIPHFFGSLKSLRYLILRRSGFGGVIPYQIGNLTNLRCLDLSSNNLWVQNLWWLSHLSSLKYLGMTSVNLQRASDWLQVVNMLPVLVELHLSECKLDNIPPSLRYVNFTSLAVLNLSANFLEYTIPTWFYNLSSLFYLDLRFNNLQGQIPNEIGNLNSLEYLDLSRNIDSKVKLPNTFWNLCNLRVLDLSYNNFSGESLECGSNISMCIGKSLEKLSLSNSQLTGCIPEWFGQLNHLKYLFLSDNSLSGHIPGSLGNLSSLKKLFLFNNQLYGNLPESFGQLSNLESLSFDSNALHGVISEAHFTRLSKLKFLGMTSNTFTFTISPNWLPPFQLENFAIRSNSIVTGFPTWLRTQNSLYYLDISSTGISDFVPNWFWDFASHIPYFNLSNNQLRGDLSNVLLKSHLIDLSLNHFKGQLPHLSPDVGALFLSKNSFFGSLSPLLCENLDDQNSLMYLDLSENHLSGEIPPCWMHWQGLKLVNLGSNNLSGNIPSSMGSLSRLRSLRLRNNSISGHLPSSLQNCKYLRIIDLGENMLSGNIPSWIGKRLKNLIFLRLQSNKFSGSIPQQICNLTSLHVLDLAHNSLSEAIPLCLDKIAAMVTEDSAFRKLSFSYPHGYYLESMLLVTKGIEWEYNNILRLIKGIDLSSNNLCGGIPHELSSLSGLRFLNLSGNYLNGIMPENIDGLKWLESLDLSKNHLSGAIPQTMSSLTFLSYLNLSYNNFSGIIPRSTQLQSFSEESFAGNPELCGDPLLKKCTGHGDSQVPPSGEDNGKGEDEDDGAMLSGFYISMLPGFVVGFWGVCGALFFKKSWRYSYFQFWDNIKDQIYVAVALKLIWLRKKVKRNRVGE